MSRHDEIKDEREAAAYLRVSLSGLRKWRKRKCGPNYSRFGKVIRYRQSELDAWIDSHSKTHGGSGIEREGDR